MKKILTFLTLAFIIASFFSCEKDEKKIEKINKSKRFFSQYIICNNIDSVNTGIVVYVGEIEGHKYKYHLYTGKRTSQMVVEHVVEECKMCKNTK